MKKVYTLALVILACIGLTVLAFVIPEVERMQLSGLVQAKDIKNASRFGGRVKEIYVQEGDKVKEGQQLVSFQDVELQSKIVAAKAALTQAQARADLMTSGADGADIKSAYEQVRQARLMVNSLGQGNVTEKAQMDARLKQAQSAHASAKTAYDNADQLLSEGVISEQKHQKILDDYEAAKSSLNAAQKAVKVAGSGGDVSIARSQLQAAQAQYNKLLKGARKEEIEIAMASVEQAKSMLTSLEAQLTETKITSPISGVVSVLNVNPGELVQPGRPVVAVINYNDLWTDVYVPEDKLHMIKMKQPVKVRTSNVDGHEFKGIVASINPKSEFVPGQGENKGGEKPSFKVKVRIPNVNLNQEFPLYPGMRVDVEFERTK